MGSFKIHPWVLKSIWYLIGSQRRDLSAETYDDQLLCMFKTTVVELWSMLFILGRED